MSELTRLECPHCAAEFSTDSTRGITRCPGCNSPFMIEGNAVSDEKDTVVLKDAIETVYGRPDTHGEPEDSFETIAGKWTAHIQALLRECEDVEEFELDPEDVANMMVDLKTSRNAEGHYHEDNYVDIAGYAECGARNHEQ